MNLGRQSSTPPVVMNLIIANAVIFLASMLYETSMVRFGLFNFDLRAGAYEVWNNFINFNSIADPTWNQAHFEIWQPFTYMFMHANFSHLFFNMFSLWMFGRTLELELGWKRFLTYYIVCGVGASLFQMGIAQIDLSHLEIGSRGWIDYMQTPTVGASGAIFGLLSKPYGEFVEYSAYVKDETKLAIQLSLGNCTTPNTFFLSDVRVEQAGKIDLVSDTIYTF
jgi:membrane associated rhomboid family serine protease